MHLVIGIVVERVTVDSVGLIYVVPCGLETVEGLNVVSESSTLREGVVDLADNEVWLRNLEGVKLSKSSVQDSRVLILEEGLGLSGD